MQVRRRHRGSLGHDPLALRLPSAGVLAARRAHARAHVRRLYATRPRQPGRVRQGAAIARQSATAEARLGRVASRLSHRLMRPYCVLLYSDRPHVYNTKLSSASTGKSDSSGAKSDLLPHASLAWFDAWPCLSAGPRSLLALQSADASSVSGRRIALRTPARTSISSQSRPRLRSFAVRAPSRAVHRPRRTSARSLSAAHRVDRQPRRRRPGRCAGRTRFGVGRGACRAAGRRRGTVGARRRSIMGALCCKPEPIDFDAPVNLYHFFLLRRCVLVCFADHCSGRFARPGLSRCQRSSCTSIVPRTLLGTHSRSAG